jgi:hypothetical protein
MTHDLGPRVRTTLAKMGVMGSNEWRRVLDFLLGKNLAGMGEDAFLETFEPLQKIHHLPSPS